MIIFLKRPCDTIVKIRRSRIAYYKEEEEEEEEEEGDEEETDNIVRKKVLCPGWYCFLHELTLVITSEKKKKAYK